MSTARGGAIPAESLPPRLGPVTDVQLKLDPPVTDSSGRFQTPEIIDADGEFQAVVRADGFMPKRTEWKSLDPHQSFEWADVRLNRQRPLEGIVLDRAGKPVPRAKIVRSDSRALLRTTSDSSGRCKLDILLDGPGFLFVEADGFRFHGQINGSTKPVRITLTRDEETPTTRMTTLPFKLSKEERRTLAEKLTAPWINPALESAKEDERTRALQWLAGADPARMLEILEKKPLHGEWEDGYVRRAAAKSLATESPDEARHGHRFHARSLISCPRLPRSLRRLASGPGRRAPRILAQALVHARAIKEADKRAIYLGWTAERLLTVGDKDRAAEIFHEGLESAKNLPTAGWSGYARGAFADSLAVIDLPAALDLIKDLRDRREFDRHHGNIARKLAR